MNYQTALIDYRRYFFKRPVSLAVRGYHLGRYGKDAQNATSFLPPLFLGEETWIRGYGYGSFTGAECQPVGSTPAAANRCPTVERLFGSRVALASIELRIPVFGTSDFGLLNLPFLPTEISPFFDGGIAYTQDQKPDFRITTTANSVPATCTSQTNAAGQPVSIYGCADRVPVFSTGLSMRFNLFGYAIMEAYLAHPFQRPQKNWVWGFQLAPGW
jgi:outer membrane protein assembly factor BamA